MMKLLMTMPAIPYPINSGGNNVFFQMIDRIRSYAEISLIVPVTEKDAESMAVLMSRWNNVRFYFYHSDKEYDNENGGAFSVRLLSKLKASVTRKLDRRLNKYKSSELLRRYTILNNKSKLNEGFINFVYNVVHSDKFDLIQIDFFELIDLVNILPENLKKVFIHHELRFVRALQELNLMETRIPKDYFLYNTIKKFEIANLNAYDAVVTLTNEDKEKLKTELRKDILIESSPVIVDIEKTEMPESYCFKNKLVFLGGSDHYPNFDAVYWFLNNCWENIRKARPDMEFHIIGKWNSKLKKEYSAKYENLMFDGFVENLSLAFEGAVMVVPLRIGSGIRIKIMDAVNKGTPFISTAIGVEGIGLEDGKDCLIADESESFVDAVLRLSGSNTLCNELRRNAKRKLDVRPDAAQLARVRLDIYKKILSLPSE
ncbi:glycosyltransferase [Dysgonomonas termitidis]|uniref:Glycosyltransferase n=1 Tax=Dysgonomonas termitidis TaxID=1516126 RepID=A0ABV9L2P6_9BACT